MERPQEEVVREQLRDEKERVAGAEPAPAPADEKAESRKQKVDADGGEAPATRDPRPATEEEPVAQADDPLTVAKQEREKYLDLAKRTQADFENYRKRAAKDIAAAGSRARLGLVREILPVLDNLERALASAPDGEADGFLEGVRLVYVDLQGVLAREGIETIEPAGEQFDPNLHEALSTREQDDAEAGVVLDVVEKGYRSPDAVIRPARVIVAA